MEQWTKSTGRRSRYFNYRGKQEVDVMGVYPSSEQKRERTEDINERCLGACGGEND